MTFTCACGRRYEIREIAGHGHGDWTPMLPMPDAALRKPWMGDVAPAAPSFTEARRTSPARPANKDSDVVVPLYQTLLTGVFVGIPAGVGLTIWAQWPWYDAPIIALCVTSATWVILLNSHRASLWVKEVILNKDINQDGYIGPTKQEWRVMGEIRHEHEDRPASTSLFDLPCPSPIDLRSFARGILDGSASFSEMSAAKYNYSATMWEALRDDFINRGWAYWKHPTERRQGTGLMAAGRAVVRAIADTPLP